MKNLLLTALAFAVCYVTAFSQATGVMQPMLEEFTQASCGPCASQNPAFNALIDANQSDFGTGSIQVNSLKYQVWWPGVDPMYDQTQAWVDPRVSYYGTNGVPDAVLNGNGYQGAPNGVSQAALDASAATMAPIEITAEYDWTSTNLDMIDITVTVTNTNGGVDFTGADKLHIALVERAINFPTAPGSNGEMDFYMVMREMWDDATFGTVAAGTPHVFTAQVPVPSYIYNLGEVGIVAFVQNDASKEIFNSDFSGVMPFPPGTVAVDMDANTSSTGPDPAGAGAFCNSDFTGEINVTNNGSTTVTSFDVHYAVNGGANVTESFSGSLAQGQSTTVTFPVASLAQGTSTISYSIDNINGGSAVITNTLGVQLADESFSVLGANAFGTSIVQDMEGGTLEAGTGYSRDLVSASSGLGPGIFYDADDAGLGNFCILDGPTYSYGSHGSTGAAGDDRIIRIRFWSLNGQEEMSILFEKVDLTGNGAPQLTFDHSYNQYAAENDRLEVLVSSDCGATWDPALWDKAGSALMTLPASTTQVSSPAAGTWTSNTIDLSAYDGQTGLTFMFRATSDYGNNLFLDNINLDYVVSTDKVEAFETTMNIMPNPATDYATISFNVEDNTELSLNVYNALGQQVKTVTTGLFNGMNTVDLSTTELAAGVYHVNLVTENGTLTQRLVVQK